MSVSDLARDTGSVAAFTVLGFVLVLLGFLLVDVLTPGKLPDLVWRERNRNATVLVVSNVLAVAAIIVASIYASHDDFGMGLLSTAVYSMLGLAMMGLAFVMVDVLTPGKLGALLVDEQEHPAVWVSAALHLAMAAIVCAAIV